MTSNSYIPKILLCGDKTKFYSIVDERRPIEIVGQIYFSGEIDGKKFNFIDDRTCTIDGKLCDKNEILQRLKTDVDYIVFNKFKSSTQIRGVLVLFGCAASQIITATQLNYLPQDNFFDISMDLKLMLYAEKSSFKTLLDVDAHFADSPLLAKGDNGSIEIDAICDKPLLPIKENIYSHVYKNFSECCFKHYDAALVSVNSPRDFDAAFMMLENCADVVIIFARDNSALVKYLKSTLKNFIRIDVFNNAAGMWLFCYRHKPPLNFAMYVVTHKALPEKYVENFPNGYITIHAGREHAEDLGFIGDNTGKNISYLNSYINEFTALYWMWKNTPHTIIGLSHYRRFFTIDKENFLTQEQALEILEDYDIILTTFASEVLQFEYVENDCGNLAKLGESIVRKHLMTTQPDYVEFFDAVMKSKIFYKCNMFVTRRYIFDSYCKWVFSFFTDAVREAMVALNLPNEQPPRQRLMGYFAERMWTTWLFKNRLRIKELEVIQVEDAQMQEFSAETTSVETTETTLVEGA